MPILDGFAATRKIRELESNGTIHGRLPIIALTANVSRENEDNCRNAGMDSFLAKPLKLQGNVHTSYLNENCVFIGTGQTSKTSLRSYPLSLRTRYVPLHDFTTIYYIYFALVSDGTTTRFV